uniref:Uncharacterized protein n=1 Tax=Arundo donax TaxID=35708 RepID=A0A0A8YZ01_ARUDO
MRCRRVLPNPAGPPATPPPCARRRPVPPPPYVHGNGLRPLPKLPLCTRGHQAAP